MAAYSDIADRCRAGHLDVFGAFHPVPDEDGVPPGTGTLVLLGPAEPGFWAAFSGSAEYRDGGPDPLDRWSTRVIGEIARDLGATALFPFGGPPWLPFQRWAVATGRAWVSPVGLLVHDAAGLWVSYRGALAVPERVALPATGDSPCSSCPDKPCLSACPTSAFSPQGYDIPACHAYLSTVPGRDCMAQGCKVRRACPAGQTYDRRPEQSAYHMSQFHPWD